VHEDVDDGITKETLAMSNRMRVQFQDCQNGKTVNTLSLDVEGTDAAGVTVDQVQACLDELLNKMPTEARWIPSRLHPTFRQMVERTKQKVADAPPGGVFQIGGNVRTLQSTYRDRGGKEYRVDVENCRGHNLQK
jgi:hypothetical protein